MKPLIQKLPVTEMTSFVARTYRTPNFEVPWHQHPEYELILISEGKGEYFIGNQVGKFEAGDIFFLGANLPHTFQKHENIITSAVVIQFLEDFWGKAFLSLPECNKVNQLFKKSMSGLKVNDPLKFLLKPLIQELELQKGFNRIITLCECINLLAENGDYIYLSSASIITANSEEQEKINAIFNFTLKSFKENISLSKVAEMANMSIPAFCNYFKRATKKTYNSFLCEIRIDYACNRLIHSDLPIINICFESGFNTLANFNKQFQKLKGMTPSKYRNRYLYRTTV